MTDSKKLSRRDWFRLRIPHQNQMLDDQTKNSDKENSDKENSDKENSDKENSDKENSAEPTAIPSSGLKPIEHPENHVGLDLASLPPMREATLSVEQVEALFTDIEKLGTDILLMQRTAGAQRADATNADTKAKLELAKSALLSGAVPRMQIRYRWQDQQWIDTLKREPDGFHIVRIAHQVS